MESVRRYPTMGATKLPRMYEYIVGYIRTVLGASTHKIKKGFLLKMYVSYQKFVFFHLLCNFEPAIS